MLKPATNCTLPHSYKNMYSEQINQCKALCITRVTYTEMWRKYSSFCTKIWKMWKVNLYSTTSKPRASKTGRVGKHWLYWKNPLRQGYSTLTLETWKPQIFWLSFQYSRFQILLYLFEDQVDLQKIKPKKETLWKHECFTSQQTLTEKVFNLTSPHKLR